MLESEQSHAVAAAAGGGDDRCRTSVDKHWLMLTRLTPTHLQGASKK